jgi:hypothetical protein
MTEPLSPGPICPRCQKPVPLNEAAAYNGRHEDCSQYTHVDLFGGYKMWSTKTWNGGVPIPDPLPRKGKNGKGKSEGKPPLR